MKYIVSIKRQKNAEGKPYYMSYEYESDGSDSVSTMLESINEGLENPVGWQCSCLQKKCGACAMIINGIPRLACSTFLKDLGKKVKLEPLSKFPVIRDLIVDRNYIFDQLKDMKAWIEKKKPDRFYLNTLNFQSAACLMCGCCLEICPNFSINSGHMGAIGIVNTYRISDQEKDAEHGAEVKDLYTKKVYNTCGKSFSCVDICPLGLPIEELMVRNIES